MDFKKQLTDDINNIFFNMEEFAEKIVVNNMEVIGLIQNIKRDLYTDASIDTSIYGVSKSYLKLYLKECDAKNMNLFVSGHIIINTKEYYIEELQNEAGILILLLSVAGAR